MSAQHECWVCRTITTETAFCPVCDAIVHADESAVVIYHTADGERLDPGAAHEAAAYYVTVQHDEPMSELCLHCGTVFPEWLEECPICHR